MKQNLIYGKGLNDLKHIPNISKDKCYSIWCAMLRRCYCSKYHAKTPTYKDCSVCPEWLIFSSFKTWFNIYYKNDYHLDKDLLILNNKVYSPTTCTFIPFQLNNLLNIKVKGDLPQGVTYSLERGAYRAQCRYWHQKQRRSIHKTLGYFKDKNKGIKCYFRFKAKIVFNSAKYYYKNNIINDALYLSLCLQSQNLSKHGLLIL